VIKGKQISGVRIYDLWIVTRTGGQGFMVERYEKTWDDIREQWLETTVTLVVRNAAGV
jgi:hypothetical protein